MQTYIIVINGVDQEAGHCTREQFDVMIDSWKDILSNDTDTEELSDEEVVELYWGEETFIYEMTV